MKCAGLYCGSQDACSDGGTTQVVYDLLPDQADEQWNSLACVVASKTVSRACPISPCVGESHSLFEGLGGKVTS